MAAGSEKTYRFIVVILLLINTFFIGSMWFAFFDCKSYNSNIFCPTSKYKTNIKVCPLTGKTLDRMSIPQQ